MRVDQDDTGSAIGLFSTTYVEPAARRLGVASALLLRGEAWMIERRMPEAATYTGSANVKLIGLYQKHGYALSPAPPEMARLARALTQAPLART